MALRAPLLRMVAVSTLLGAAVGHASVVDVRFDRWWLEGVLLLVLQLVETALALALVRSGSRRLYVAAIGVSVGTGTLWTAAHAGGVVGPPDPVATWLELATALALLPLVVRPRVGALVGIALVVAAGTAVGVLGGTAPSHGHGHGAEAFGPGEYPLGEPLHTPTQSRGPGFYFAAWPLPTVVLELGVGPDVAGINTFDVIVVDHVGNRLEVPDLRLSASLPGRGLGPLRFRAARLSPGHYVVDVARLTAPGAWRVLVEGRRHSAGPVLFRHTFAVPVGPHM